MLQLTLIDLTIYNCIRKLVLVKENACLNYSTTQTYVATFL